MISLLLNESKAKRTMSVNNKDICIAMYVDIRTYIHTLT